MNKLISRNPILRFKEGKKILKFQNAGILSYKGRDGIDYEAFSGPRGWYYRKKGTLDIFNMPKNYVTTTGIRFYDANGNIIKSPSNNLNNSSSPRDYSFMTEGRLPSELAKDKKLRESYFNAQKKKLGFTSPLSDTLGNDQTGGATAKPVRRKIDWNQQYNNFSNNLTTSLKAWLTNEGVDYNNVESVQNYLLRKLGNNALGKWGVDKRWGSASQVAWNKFASQTDFTPKVNINPELIEKDRQTIINLVLPLPKLPTIPEGGISNFTPLSTTYNRAGVREFLRNKGVNPYNFSGDQRRALRMVMNGQGTDEDKALVLSMGIFKKGGQLPSRNPITRFKNRNFS